MRNALVPISALARENGVSNVGQRPNADFVAHLIATAAKAPQTRARRRAEPGQAVAAYRALGQWPILPGLAVSRSL